MRPRAPAPAERPPDPELLALVSEPYSDADEVREGLAALLAASASSTPATHFAASAGL